MPRSEPAGRLPRIAGRKAARAMTGRLDQVGAREALLA
jgi:hypothetical protein